MLFLYPASENPHNALGPKVKRRYFCGLRFGNLHQLSGPRQICLSVGASSNSPDGGVTAYPRTCSAGGMGSKVASVMRLHHFNGAPAAQVMGRDRAGA